MSESVLPGVDAELRERREAAIELGAALRELNAAAVSTEVPAEVLRAAARKARELVPPLEAEHRTHRELPGIDGGPLVRMYNPAAGPANPLSPPMAVEIADGRAVGTCTLGLIYEGPPGYVHGGISALLIDQILGHVNAAHGMSGMTVVLSTRYRRPVPLQVPLRITAQLVGNEERRIMSKAAIATADAPGTVLVEGEGTFVQPRAERARQLFGEDWVRAQSRTW